MQVIHKTTDGHEVHTVEKWEGVRYIIIDKYDRDGEHIASGVTLEKCTDKEKHFAEKARKG